MSTLGSYPTRTFKESQKFLVLDPETQSTSLVLGRDLVEYITPQSTYVFAEQSRAVAQNEDYQLGALIQTAGDLTAGDNFAGTFLVVPGGDGDFPMANGNDLLVIKGDILLREQLASNTPGKGSDLVAYTGTTDTVTEALDKRTIYVGSVAEGLAGLSGADGYQYRINGWHESSDIGGGNFYFDASAAKSGHDGIKTFSPTVPAVSAQAGATLDIRTDNYRAGAGETDPSGTGVFVRDQEQIFFPQMGGALNDGTDSKTAIEAARDYCEASGAALGLYGTYSYAAAPELAVSNLKIMPFGEVIFKHTGSGPALSFDAGAVSGTVYGCEMFAPVIVEGNASSGSVILRAMIQSKLDLEVREMTTTAFDVQFGVLSEYRLASTINRAAMTLVPTKGVVIDQRGTGEFNAACKFHLVMEGIDGLGVDLVKCSHATFTGTSEGNVGGGVRDTADCKGNNWDNFYCEVNGGVDFELYGERNHFINPTALSSDGGNNVELVTAENTIFEGGFLRTVNCQATSSNSTFIGVATSDNASLGIKGSGSMRIINCVEKDINAVTTGTLQDVLGDSGSWLPTLTGATTPGSVTYTAQNGYFSVIGNQMQFSVDITVSSLGGATGTALLSLPAGYVSESPANQSVMVDEVSGIALSGTGKYLIARIGSGSGVATLVSIDPSGTNAGQSISGFSSGSIIRMTGSLSVSKS